MWVYEPIAKLICKAGAFVVVTDVRMFGPPWRKPTSIFANFKRILWRQRTCSGGHDHIRLHGNAPCGKSWTAVASPYWPDVEHKWVDACKFLYFSAEDGRHPPLHFDRFAAVPLEVPGGTLLEEMHFV